jgi:hypothetical protein
MQDTVITINLPCFGGFRSSADDPPKPWDRWIWFLETMGLPVKLHRVAFSFNSNLKQEMNQEISEDRNFIKKDTRIKLKRLTVRRD